MTLSQGLFLFLETKIKPYHAHIDVRWQQFREENLWEKQIEIVYTANEAGIKALFEKYAQRGNSWLQFEDCVRMINESVLKIKKNMLQHAFVMSK